MPFDPTQIFEEYYDDIKKVIQSVSRKKTNQPQEIEECVSYTFEQLVNNDYAILRNFKEDGRANIQTFLYTVINRLLIDKFRKDGTLDAVGGTKSHFRASTHAKRLGIYAERLERLLLQKKHSVEEAYQVLKNDAKFSWTYDHTLKISNELWRPDKFVTEAHEDIDEIPSSKSESNSSENPEKALENKNLESKASIIENSLEKALQGLSHEDSLMLKLRFTSQKSVSEISRILGQSRKVVERKIRGLLNRLKDILLSNGMNYDEVSEMIKTRYG
tara:strand:+ start:161 stop:982 length:822 start_codon:yes stop_codon:yes gene_type:complete